MKNILLLTDFSALARHAADQGILIATQLDASIWLLNAFPITPHLPQPLDIQLAISTAEQKQRESLSKLKYETRRLRLLSMPGSLPSRPVIHPVTAEGQPAECAAELAAKQHSELIIIGLSRKSYGDMFFSGVIKAILKRVQCPVLAIPEQYPVSFFRHILFAAGLKTGDEVVIRALVSFCSKLNANLTVMHISYPALLPDMAEQIRISNFSESIKSLYPDIVYSNQTADSVAGMLAKSSIEKKADVIVLCYREHPFWYRLFNENPIKKLIEQSVGPLLIFPENSGNHE